VALLRSKKVRLITLGGGHDWAWPDFADWGAAPLINFDAHLDMRPPPQDTEYAGHSGTPFRRILEKERSRLPLSVVGLQSHCNARAHLEWAHAFQVTTIFLEELPPSQELQWKHLMNKIALGSEAQRLGLSVDMDCFAQMYAPGVSAPQPLGLDPGLVLKFLTQFGQKVQHLGIYECNPRYDQGSATSRLAAKIIHEFLFL
jgi:formiminoglutamase